MGHNHVDDLRGVFERFTRYKLRMHPLKCASGVFFGKFIEFTVHRKWIDFDPTEAKDIQAMEPPRYLQTIEKINEDSILCSNLYPYLGQIPWAVPRFAQKNMSFQ